jgi:hypothetical protein
VAVLLSLILRETLQLVNISVTLIHHRFPSIEAEISVPQERENFLTTRIFSSVLKVSFSKNGLYLMKVQSIFQKK